MNRITEYAAANPAESRLSSAPVALMAITATRNIWRPVSARWTRSSVSKRVENVVCPSHAHQMRAKRNEKRSRPGSE